MIKEAAEHNHGGVLQGRVMKLVVLLRVFKVMAMDEATTVEFGFVGVRPNRPNSPVAKVPS